MATIWTQVEEGPIADHETVRMSPPFGQVARRLQQCGFTPAEAANLLARCAGLPAAPTGWTIRWSSTWFSAGLSCKTAGSAADGRDAGIAGAPHV